MDGRWIEAEVHRLYTTHETELDQDGPVIGRYRGKERKRAARSLREIDRHRAASRSYRCDSSLLDVSGWSGSVKEEIPRTVQNLASVSVEEYLQAGERYPKLEYTNHLLLRQTFTAFLPPNRWDCCAYIYRDPCVPGRRLSLT